MTTTTLTKLQARQAIDTFNYANLYLKGKDLAYLEKQAKYYNPKYENITEKDGAFVWIRHHDGVVYEYIIDCHEIQLHKVVKINDEAYNIDDLIRFLGDLTNEEQHEALEQLDLSAIELYIKKRTGKHVTLYKQLYKNADGKWNLTLCSDNLVEDTGICKAMLRRLYIECGRIGFGIDKYTGEQTLWIPSLYFRYEHQDAGTNGHEFGRVKFDGKNFIGYNYEAEKYEAI